MLHKSIRPRDILKWTGFIGMGVRCVCVSAAVYQATGVEFSEYRGQRQVVNGYAQSAEMIQDTKSLTLHFAKGTWFLSQGKAHGFRAHQVEQQNDRDVKLTGEVHISLADGIRIESDRAHYRSDKREVFLEGHVRLKSILQGLDQPEGVVTARFGHYQDKTQHLVLTEQVQGHLMTQESTVRIDADRMTMNVSSRSVKFEHQATLVMADAWAKADIIHLVMKNKKLAQILLTGHPVIRMHPGTREETRLEGNQVSVKTGSLGGLTQVHARGNVRLEQLQHGKGEGETFFYDRIQHLMSLKGDDAWMTFGTSHVVGKDLQFSRQEGVISVTGGKLQWENNQNTQHVLSGQRLRLSIDQQRQVTQVWASGHVHVQMKETDTYSDTLSYRRDNQTMILKGMPARAKIGEKDIVGRVLRYHLGSQELQVLQAKVTGLL